MLRALTVLVVLLLPSAAQAAIPAVQAHRGGPVSDGKPAFPEETLPAFRNAAENLNVVLELDAKLTADRVPVVFHDASLDRTTNCEGLVVERTLSELAACRADVLGAPGNDLPTAPAPRPERIPTLAEVLAFAKADGIGINLEIKNVPTDDDYDPTPAFANRVMDVVLESKIPAERVIIQSFIPEHLDVAEGRMPGVELALLSLASTNALAIDVAATRGYDWVSPGWPIDKAYVDEAHARDLRVVPYTLNKREAVRAAADAGVDAIITDDPLMALKTLDTRAPRVGLKPLGKKVRRVRRTGRLAVRVTADEAATVALAGRVGGKAVRGAKIRFEAAGSRKVTLRLTRAARRGLKGKKRAKVRLTAKTRDVAGNDGQARAVSRLR